MLWSHTPLNASRKEVAHALCVIEGSCPFNPRLQLGRRSFLERSWSLPTNLWLDASQRLKWFRLRGWPGSKSATWPAPPWNGALPRLMPGLSSSDCTQFSHELGQSTRSTSIGLTYNGSVRSNHRSHMLADHTLDSSYN